MPTYTNPYNYVSPLGDALGKLGQTLMSGPTEAQKITAAEEALKLRNARVNSQSVADIFKQYGTPGFDRNAAVADSIAGGLDPDILSKDERYLSANTNGAASPLTDNAVVGAGGAYSSTAKAFGIDQGNQNARAANTLAETAREFNDKPLNYVDTSGNPVVGTQATAVGQHPLLSDADAKGFNLDKYFNASGGGIGSLPAPEQRALGAESLAPAKTPSNYIMPDGSVHLTIDGTTDAQTGVALPPGGHMGTITGNTTDTGLTNATQSKAQQQNLALDQLDALSKYTRGLVQQDPTNVGLPGFAKGVVQDVNQVADGLAQGLGFHGIDAAIQNARAKAAAAGLNGKIISTLFDPTLPKLRQAYGLLAFTGASALAGQRGQGLSDKDVEHIEKMIGSPESLFESQANLLAGLDGLDNLSSILRNAVQPYAGGGPAGAPATAGATPPAASAGPVKVVTPDDALKLPPGTQFQTPDGRIKVRP